MDYLGLKFSAVYDRLSYNIVTDLTSVGRVGRGSLVVPPRGRCNCSTCRVNVYNATLDRWGLKWA